MKPAIPVLAALFALAGCQSTSTQDSAPADNSDQGHDLARTVGETIGKCWFAGGETAFTGLIYSPEPNNSPPRVLIVRKDKPQDLPRLVIEARGGTRLAYYGPLLDSPAAARIRTDLSRWESGNTACN